MNLTYDQNLNDVFSSPRYFGIIKFLYGVDTAVISTVIKTNSGYGEGNISFILRQLLPTDSTAVLT